MRIRRALMRRLFVTIATVMIAVPVVPAPVVAATPAAAPNVTVTGPNVFQANPNDPVYFRPMAGKTPYTLLRTYGLAPVNEYHSPRDVAVVGSYAYVLDASNYRILKRKASDLSYVAKSPSLVGRVVAPQRIASDGTYLYVTDSVLNAVVVFRVSTMAYVGKFGSTGTGKGHFQSPVGITVRGGRLYVADSSNDRIVKLTPWPIHWVAAYGSDGGGTGHFRTPMGVAVIGSYLYVADAQNSRVVRMSTAMNGAGWKTKGTYGAAATSFMLADELATDGTYLYVHVMAWASVVKLTSSLGYVKDLTATSGPTAWGPVMGMDATTTALYMTHAPLSAPGPGYNNQITRNSRTTLAVQRTSGSATPSASQWMAPVSATSDGTSLYIGDVGRILVCAVTTTACTRSISLPAGYSADGLATDGTSLFVVDNQGNRVFRVNIATGNVNGSYGTAGAGNDNLANPTGIVYLPTLAQLAVLDAGNNRVVVRSSSSLAYVGQAGSAGSGDTQLVTPQAIATDGVFLYISDTGNHRVVKWLAGSLAQVAAIPGGLGSGPGQFDLALGIATDGDSVWVVDSGNGRVQRLAALNLAFQSQTTSTAAAPFGATGIWGLASVGGMLLLLDLELSRAYLEWGGGPMKVTATPSDGTSPWSIGFTWGGAAPTGWTSPLDTGYLFATTATRYLAWTPAAVGGSFNAIVNKFDVGGTPRTISLVPDSTAPTVPSTPRAMFASLFNASSTSLATQILWSTADSGAGVAKTELARSVNGGPWSTVSTQFVSSGPATHMFAFNLNLKSGATYRFRARVTDAVGNVSGWKAGPTFVPVLVQEAGIGVVASSGWTTQAVAAALGGHLRTASVAGKTLTYKGTMSSLAVVVRGGSGYGSFKVYLDGVLLGTAITGAGITVDRVMAALVPPASKGIHTVKLVTNGDGPVYIDAFAIIR